jgi:N-acetylmuramoyl-L-alanine amidase
MPAPEKIKYLIIHTSDSRWGSVDVIRHWHVDPPPMGRGWVDIGYHYVITNGFLTYQQLKNNVADQTFDGKVCNGRDTDHDGDVEEEVGAHCVGFNDKSLGICLVGAHGIYTQKQTDQLYALCKTLMAKYKIPVSNVLGHYETENGRSQGKTCPDIDMKKWRAQMALLLQPKPTT